MPALHLRENALLADYTTFKTGGPARHFVIAQTVDELEIALALARQHHWSVFVLAGGSNLIISSKGFDGLVIQLNFENWKLKTENFQLIADASVSMKTLVDKTISAGLAGLEWSGGLPGSFGGAVRGNAGAFGGEIKDSIESVMTLNAKTGQPKTWTNAECQFGYRDSYFKQNPDEIIISASLKLAPGNPAELRQMADDHIAYRQAKHPLEYPNAGSIFKNVAVAKISADQIEQWKANIKTDPFPVVPAAKIISDAGLQGLRVGDAQISEKHTNYIVNLGAVTGEDILALIRKVQASVKEKYGIELEIEPELVGF